MLRADEWDDAEDDDDDDAEDVDDDDEEERRRCGCCCCCVLAIAAVVGAFDETVANFSCNSRAVNNSRRRDGEREGDRLRSVVIRLVSLPGLRCFDVERFGRDGLALLCWVRVDARDSGSFRLLRLRLRLRFVVRSLLDDESDRG